MTYPTQYPQCLPYHDALHESSKVTMGSIKNTPMIGALELNKDLKHLVCFIVFVHHTNMQSGCSKARGSS